MEDGKCKGFGYVAFEKAEEAARAKEDGIKELFQGKYFLIANHEPKAYRETKIKEHRDRKALQKHQMSSGQMLGMTDQGFDTQNMLRAL